MRKGDFLFVYGTLRKGEGADLSLNFHVDFVGQDDINGDLYDLGPYPGVKTECLEDFDNNLPVVHGDVFRLADESITNILDAYEGYPYLYNRLQVSTRSGKTVWVYTYNHEVSDAQRMPVGDWKTRSPSRLTA